MAPLRRSPYFRGELAPEPRFEEVGAVIVPPRIKFQNAASPQLVRPYTVMLFHIRQQVALQHLGGT